MYFPVMPIIYPLQKLLRNEQHLMLNLYMTTLISTMQNSLQLKLEISLPLWVGCNLCSVSACCYYKAEIFEVLNFALR